MDRETAFKLADKDEAELVTCKCKGHYGFLVCYQGRVAIVDEEFHDVTHLPKFITDEPEAKRYLRALDQAYEEGVSEGREQIKTDFRKLMDCESQGSARYQVERHERFTHPETQ